MAKDGYRVLPAYDGQQAIELARRCQPDLIILDLMLPQIDGLEVCRILHTDCRVGLYFALASAPDGKEGNHGHDHNCNRDQNRKRPGRAGASRLWLNRLSRAGRRDGGRCGRLCEGRRGGGRERWHSCGWRNCGCGKRCAEWNGGPCPGLDHDELSKRQNRRWTEVVHSEQIVIRHAVLE
jgi:CheY-like chemotaxis protein